MPEKVTEAPAVALGRADVVKSNVPASDGAQSAGLGKHPA